jgi:SnoaL-like domain
MDAHSALREDKLAITETVNNWVVYRDSGFWDRFRTVWAPDGWMSATWFQGPAEKFIEVSMAGWEKGVSILHFLGGTAIDVKGHRAIAQTKMTINQRGLCEGVVVDVVCTGRFYDFFEKQNGRWLIVRRQPIYEKDRMDPVDPGLSVKLDQALLAEFPEGYRNLGYLQTKLGFTLKKDMPGLKGAPVQALYAHGQKWLDGAVSAFPQ